MRFLSLFAGIGGLDLGLERAGMTCVGQVEIDPYCRAVLAKHWPNVPRHDDVRTREYVEGEADVICGGFPCQDVSNAGLRAGIAGKRSGLYRELVRAIRVVRPLYAIVENVAALLGRGMGRVLGDLAEIGYDAEWDCLPACALGAPHCRDRVFITASNPVGMQQRWKEPCLWEVGRAREGSHAWDDPWETALRRLRRMDDGSAYGVERTDGIRNAVVPQVAEVVGRSIMASLYPSLPVAFEGEP